MEVDRFLPFCIVEGQFVKRSRICPFGASGPENRFLLGMRKVFQEAYGLRCRRDQLRLDNQDYHPETQRSLHRRFEAATWLPNSFRLTSEQL